MRKNRLRGFILAILGGLLLGLAYGWLINPGEARHSTLADLRGDYKADTVLMVAEVYAVDQDIEAAQARLAKLAPTDINGFVKEALIMAQQMDYSEAEMGAITSLQMALNEPGALETGTP
jgi:outer membrane PBP1 activator LpoA protein